MTKTIKSVFLSGIMLAGMHSAWASSAIQAGVMFDFEDGLSHGWIAGQASEDEGLLPSVTMDESGNHYFKYQAYGTEFGRKSGPNRRMAFFNKSSYIMGDYSDIPSVSADFMASSSTEDKLYLRLNFEGNDGRFYSSKNAQILDTDGVWRKLSFSLSADEYYVNDEVEDEFGSEGDLFKPVDDAAFADAIKHIHEFKIVSNEEYPQWSAVDVVKATVGMDNFTLNAKVSAVPVPAAVWFMVSGLLGLRAFSSKKLSER